MNCNGQISFAYLYMSETISSGPPYFSYISLTTTYLILPPQSCWGKVALSQTLETVDLFFLVLEVRSFEMQGKTDSSFFTNFS